jgi:hypothetical protein
VKQGFLESNKTSWERLPNLRRFIAFRGREEESESVKERLVEREEDMKKEKKVEDTEEKKGRERW